MSSSIYFEFALSCPHKDCRFKSKKFDSIEAVNMHISKTHEKNLKVVEIRDKNKRLRLVLRSK